MAPDTANLSFVGQTIGGRYNITRPLGEGGTAAVFEAVDLQTRASVAVKFLHANLATQRDMVARFQREITAGTTIRHPNVIAVLDHGTTPDQRQYMVQELLRGHALNARLANGPIPVPEALRIVTALLDGLAATHAAHVLHRDIKPENIFLCESPQGVPTPKLIDFGMSKPLGEADAASPEMFRTNAGAALGTPEYMSPEQARGVNDLDVRTDLWSLGAVLFEMLAGRKMIQGASLAMIITRLVMEPPPRIETVVPSLSPALAQAIQGALEPDRNRRYASAVAFRDALRVASGEAPASNPVGFASTMAIPAMPAPAAVASAVRPDAVQPSWDGATVLAPRQLTAEQQALIQQAMQPTAPAVAPAPLVASPVITQKPSKSPMAIIVIVVVLVIVSIVAVLVMK